MASSSPDSQDGSTEDEYEAEYVSAARWDGYQWEYRVHWYKYSSDEDSWEPEENLTNYGSAGLVSRFWKAHPGKRHTRPPITKPVEASADFMVEERKRFLNERPKDKPVKGVPQSKKTSNKIVLIGDPESGDDLDILETTDSDENIPHPSSPASSSSDDVPLDKRQSRALHAGRSSGIFASSRPRASNIATKQVTQIRKPPPIRPAVSLPVLPTTQTARTVYPAPVVKATKIARGPMLPSRRGRKFVREEMQPGSISKNFGGIGAKGKQVERAGEVVALGRRASGSAMSAPSLKPSNAFAGMSMRKRGPALSIDTAGATNGAGPSRIGNGTPVDSPIQTSPLSAQPRQEPNPAALVDDFVSGIEAMIQPAPDSPPNSLFDGPHDDDEAQELVIPQPSPVGPLTSPLAGVNMDFGHFMMDSPEASMTSIPQEIRPELRIQTSQAALSVSSLQPGQWHWKGELYVTTQEPGAAENDSRGGTNAKATENRVCEVIVYDLAIQNENVTKSFTWMFDKYIGGKINIRNTSDLHMLYAELAAGAFEVTQAAWMTLSDTGENADVELWQGILRKMEVTVQGTIVKIYNAHGTAMSNHVLLVPCSLVQNFPPQPAFVPLVEHFKFRTTGFVALLCRRTFHVSEPRPRLLLAQKLPKCWQKIPPELGEQLRDHKCLVFPNPDADVESDLLCAELMKYNAVVLDGVDLGGHANIIFVHRAWVKHLSFLLGLTHRRKRLSRRFYVYGSGGSWSVAEWNIQEIWVVGGMITFTPAALLEDPSVVSRVVQTIQGDTRWHAYIEPKVVGAVTLREADTYATFVLERVLSEIAFSHDLAPYPLALTSPPGRRLVDQFEWMHAQYSRANQSSEELRQSCEEETIRDYKNKLEGADGAPSAQSHGNSGERWGPNPSDAAGNGFGGGITRNGGAGATNTDHGWDNSSGGWGDTANGWESLPPNPPSPTNNQAPAAAPSRVDFSQVASNSRIQEMSDEVIEGLKTMQIQPCFMREIRRFVVIDSKARAAEKKERRSKIEVEIFDVEEFIADFVANG